ncbi:MAG: hypothetical protein J0H67_02665, partial [Rhodospirillales bacterium]|nr:hypothetical protein [Rhodospirillales bacterium]
SALLFMAGLDPAIPTGTIAPAPAPPAHSALPVMAGLDPAIPTGTTAAMDGRVEPGHDDGRREGATRDGGVEPGHDGDGARSILA